MPLTNDFHTAEQTELVNEFLDQGYVVREVQDKEALDELRKFICKTVCDFMKLEFPADPEDFLNSFSKTCPVEKLNEVRLHTYRTMNKETWLRPTYFSLARPVVETLVGNELAMQNKINLSIQLPNDNSSLLPIHADVFGGETPFQVVEWLPLVNCTGTQSMFILPRKKSEELYESLDRYEKTGMSNIFDDVKDDLIWVDVPYGTVMVFSPNFLHGNVINTEEHARWSFNCRITGLFTPYASAEKKLGSFYLPITTRPVTKLGINYNQPSGFKE